MTQAKRVLQEKARDLRQQGWSLGQIATELGVSKGSVSVWVRDVVLTDAQKAALDERHRYIIGRLDGAHANRERARLKRQVWQDEGREHAQHGSALFLKGCMLYWAEGAKRRNRVHFVNSDPYMMRLFMRFLREELGVQEQEFALYLHCHKDYMLETERIIDYWLRELALTRSNFRTVYIKKGSESRKNILVNGIATITVSRTDLAMHIYGAIQAYGQFDNPDWLF